jgi:hypothetical protein
MSTMNPVVRTESGETPVAISRGSFDKVMNRALSVFKGALIVGAVVYVTITWALQAVARFN